MISVDNVKVSVTSELISAVRTDETSDSGRIHRDVLPVSTIDRWYTIFFVSTMRLTIFRRSWRRRRRSLKRRMNASSVSRNEASHRERSSKKSWCVHFVTVAYDLRVRCMVLQYLDEYQWKLWHDTELSTRSHLNINVRQVVSGLYSILKRNVHDDTYALTGTWSWVDSA